MNSFELLGTSFFLQFPDFTENTGLQECLQGQQALCIFTNFTEKQKYNDDNV